MPWFCLQSCNYNTSEILKHTDQIASLAHRDGVTISAVAFERYNLGPNGTLVTTPGLFDLNAYLQTNATLASLVKHRIAMVSSAPHLLQMMHELFDNPAPFVEALVADLVQHNISGVNVDLEPTSSNATPQDAQSYAAFLKLLRVRLGESGKFLSIAGATWSPIWNLTAIAEALKPTGESPAVGYFTSMNTYTYQYTVFAKELNLTLDTFSEFGDPRSVVVGLETWPGKLSAEDVGYRFKGLATAGICQIAIWDMPLPANFTPYLANFTTRSSAAASP